MTPRPSEPPWLGGPSPGLRVWALEPYYGGSHRQFLEGLRSFSSHEVSVHGLPGRHWKWRMHGGAAALARTAHAAAGAGGPHVLFVSDMLDLPTYRSLAPSSVGRVPAMLYFHENQLTYPLPPGVERDLGYGMRQLVSAATAEAVYFNSSFHRTEFLDAAADLVAAMPDEQPTWLVDEVAARSRVLPLGCDLRAFDAYAPRGSTRDRSAGRREAAGGAGRWGGPAQGPLIVWNQRWEYDKAPGEFFRALYALQEQCVAFRVAVAGANQGLPTAEFVEARRRLGGHVVQWGRLDRFPDYADLLWQADVVVSTALHEFFGVAIVEALYCGCRPVLPRRLSYPELVPAEMHDRVLYDEGGLVPLLREALDDPRPWSQDWQRTWVSPYDWGCMAQRYDREVWACWEKGSSRT